MKTLAVVTARGGSRRLPGKNIKMLGGKPLIWWSIAVGQRTCSHLVTSTDDDEIARVAVECGSPVVHCPLDLERNDVHWDQVRHAVSQTEENTGQIWDAVLLMQPTSPFRTEEDIIGAMDMMEHVEALSVVSIIEFNKKNTIYTLGYAGRLRDISEWRQAPDTQNGRPRLYVENGAIFLINKDHLMAGGDCYGPRGYGYLMPVERSIDIDFHADFDAAQAILDQGNQFLSTNKKVIHAD